MGRKSHNKNLLGTGTRKRDQRMQKDKKGHKKRRKNNKKSKKKIRKKGSKVHIKIDKKSKKRGQKNNYKIDRKRIKMQYRKANTKRDKNRKWLQNDTSNMHIKFGNNRSNSFGNCPSNKNVQRRQTYRRKSEITFSGLYGS